jgi:ABC-type tungstate transport system substrate-binding protein
MATKTTGALTTHVTKPEHTKTANVVGSVTTTTMIPSGMIFFSLLEGDILTYIVPLKNFPTKGFLNYAAHSFRTCCIVYRLGFCLSTSAMYN